MSGTALAAGSGAENVSFEHRNGAKIKSRIVCGWSEVGGQCYSES